MPPSTVGEESTTDNGGLRHSGVEHTGPPQPASGKANSAPSSLAVPTYTTPSEMAGELKMPCSRVARHKGAHVSWPHPPDRKA